MDVVVKPDGEGRYIISCPSDMQWQARQQLLSTFVTATAGADVTGVILDLDGVSYISSAGLGGIFSLRKHVLAIGGRLVAARPSVSISRLLKTVNLEALMPVVPSLAEARTTLNDATETDAV